MATKAERDTRDALIRSYRGSGLSVRQVASACGLSYSMVQRALAEGENESPKSESSKNESPSASASDDSFSADSFSGDSFSGLCTEGASCTEDRWDYKCRNSDHANFSYPDSRFRDGRRVREMTADEWLAGYEGGVR